MSGNRGPEGEGAGRIERIGLSVLVDAETYLAMCIRWEPRYFKGWGGKVYLWFKILDGPFAGLEVPRIYNVYKIVPREGRAPTFIATLGQDITRDFKRLAGDNGDVLDLALLVDRIFLIEVVTVEKDHAKAKLPPACQYSKVARIHEKDAIKGRHIQRQSEG